MIGGDRVTDVQEAVGAIHAVYGGGAGLGRLGEGSAVDVGGAARDAVAAVAGGASGWCRSRPVRGTAWYWWKAPRATAEYCTVLARQ